MPEELLDPNGREWQVVFDPAEGYGWLRPARVVGLMLRSRGRPRPRAELEDVLEAIQFHDREAMYVAMIDEDDQVFAIYVVSVGGPNSTVVDATSLLRAVLLADPAAGVVLIHNHPSGEPLPSPDDEAITRRFAMTLPAYGYELLDHLVIGYQGTFSFAEAGIGGL
jgi:DNA repair protein RadC